MPGLTLTKIGFLAIGRASRDVRVSRFDARMRRGMLDGSDIAAVSRKCPGHGRNRIWMMTDKSARSIQTHQVVSGQRRTTTDEKGSLSSPFHGGDTGSNSVGDAIYHR